MALSRDDQGKLDMYTWPEGYPIYYLDGENSILCPLCARKSDHEDEIPQFRPVAAGINDEDPALYCDQCSSRIEPAYEVEVIGEEEE